MSEKYSGRKIGILVCLVVLMLVIVSCGKKEKKLQYGAVYGVATGIADFTVEPPRIDIDNILAPVGVEIDYTSKLDIKKGDEVFSITVNASRVRIQEPGTYQVEYKFQYGTSVYTEFIKVTITDDESVTIPDGESQMMWETGHAFTVHDSTTGESETNPGVANESEHSGDDTWNHTGDNAGNSIGNNTGNNAGNSTGNHTGDNAGNSTGNNTGNNTDNSAGNNIGNNNGNSVGNGTGNNIGNGTGESFGNGNGNSAGNETDGNQGGSGQGNAIPDATNPGGESQTTSKKELITEAGQGVWKDSDIPNAVIELLSGEVVTIQCSTSRYIVATRTDTTTVERDGGRYQVSRLVIIFNNGTEQTLETIEKRID